MITKRTTLILGAGASKQFGFPTGYELKQRVLSLVGSAPEFGSFSQIHVEQFKAALLRSGKTSVDSFLEHRPEFILVGKTAIAITLITCESEDILFSSNGDSWYGYLFNQLNTQFNDFDKNKLSILTFNYDRSLEQYLFTCLINAYGKSIEKCAEKLKSISIVHLHGDLGELQFLGNTNFMRPYSTILSDFTVNVATQRIRIIHEGIENEPQFAQAQKILSESEVICFLGFGYHPLNLERLGFNVNPKGIYNYRGKYILGSTFGLTQVESNQVNRYGISLRPHTADFDYRNWDILQYLREMGVLHGN